MKFNSQICTTREQSERLLSLGLKKETADMVLCKPFDCEKHKYSDGCVKIVLEEEEDLCKDDIPAWSLHRLIEMYVERYISCSMNLKDLTYEWIINEIEIHIKEEDFNKEYLVC